MVRPTARGLMAVREERFLWLFTTGSITGCPETTKASRLSRMYLLTPFFVLNLRLVRAMALAYCVTTLYVGATNLTGYSMPSLICGWGR